MSRALLVLPLLALSCGEPVAENAEPSAVRQWRGDHVQTMLLGQSDNAEVVALVPGTHEAVVVGSKARRLSLLRIDDRLAELRSARLFPGDPTESELTHVTVASDGTFAAVTRTLVHSDDHEIDDCRGELVLVDVSDGPSFGQVMATVPVGPMPDAVDLSPDGRWAVVANERDVVWGKCDGVEDLEPPSLSVVDLSGGPASAIEVTRILMPLDPDREPESVRFSTDSDLVVTTLQDSHEVAFLRISEALAGTAAPWVVSLPPNSLGADPWPDGLTGFIAADGAEYFAAAGEANDTIYVLDRAGAVVGQTEVSPADIPSDFPRDGTWGPLFRPDSLTSFTWQTQPYIAASLKGSGAVAVWKVADPGAPVLATVVKVGHDEQASPDEPSSIGTEGIAASDDGLLLTANESESSVSLVLAR